MKIANPIYDVFFKYLMEDVESAKIIISTVIKKEIISLVPMAQEHTIFLEQYQLTLYRMDFKAVILTAEGAHEKILIELQKAKNLTDIYRFRGYLGDNYKNADSVNEDNVTLPITCIYFIGYPVPIKSVIVRNLNTYQDAITSEKIKEKIDLLELLNHNTYFIFIDNLPLHQKDSVIFDILDIFDQRYIFNKSKQWILDIQEDSKGINKKKQQLIMRLQQATLEAELLEKAELEELYLRGFENEIKQYQREATTERKMKEEERKMKEEERKMKEEALKMKEEERKMKEEERKMKEEALKMKEEERKMKEAAFLRIKELERLLKLRGDN